LVAKKLNNMYIYKEIKADAVPKVHFVFVVLFLLCLKEKDSTTKNHKYIKVIYYYVNLFDKKYTLLFCMYVCICKCMHVCGCVVLCFFKYFFLAIRYSLLVSCWTFRLLTFDLRFAIHDYFLRYGCFRRFLLSCHFCGCDGESPQLAHLPTHITSHWPLSRRLDVCLCFAWFCLF